MQFTAHTRCLYTVAFTHGCAVTVAVALHTFCGLVDLHSRLVTLPYTRLFTVVTVG